MNNQIVQALYLPELGVILVYIVLYLGYFYAATREIVRQREHKRILEHSVWITAQLANLALLFQVFNLRHASEINAWNGVPVTWRLRAFAGGELFLLLLFAGLTVRLVRVQIAAAQELDNDSIAEAIMNLPGGFCFADGDGRVVLANAVLQAQIHALTGRPLADANTAWERISQRSERAAEPDGGAPLKDESVLYCAEDETVWRFRRKAYEIDHRTYFQIDGEDVTELVRSKDELQSVNQRISHQNRRTRELIGDIFNKKSEQEILDMQRRVHHEVGRCIVTANRYLSEQPDREKLNSLLELWEKTFLWIPEREEKRDMTEREQEISKAAEIGGCEVILRGKRPRGETMYLLYLAAVREAVTNSMQHAGATRVNVDGTEETAGLQVVISDNGVFRGGAIVEGVGLGKLRKKLEQAGIRMEMRGGQSVSMILHFPEKEGVL